jgi:hypothetical protein
MSAVVAQQAPVQDKVTLIQTNVGIVERAMEAYEAAKERDRAAVAAPTVQEPEVSWGVDWGKAGDKSCAMIIKRLPDGKIEVVAVEYEP